MFFFVSFLVYGDYLNFGFSPAFYATITARVIFLVFSTIILILLKHVKTVKQHNYLVFFWSITYIVLSIYINTSRSLTNINFTYIDTLIVLAFFLIFPNTVSIKAILAGILTIGDLVVIVFFKSPLNDLSLKTIVLAYIVANVLGFFIANRLQYFRHKQYHTFIQEQDHCKELEKVAFIDYLTGALNRRKFFQLGSLEFDKFTKYKKSFSIIILDLDLFKRLNDKFGHDAGDHYLKAFTNIIVENKRNNDILGRLGGEEFALILPETNINCALEMAERLRRLCDERKIYLNNQLLHTTVSIGITKVEENDRTFQDTLKRADEALYQAKENGRNQVRFKLKQA